MSLGVGFRGLSSTGLLGVFILISPMYVILIIPCSLGLGGLAGGWPGRGVVECGLAPPAIKHYCIAVLTTLSNCEL